MGDDHNHRDPDEWPPGLSGARAYADPADVTLPPPSAQEPVERAAAEALASRLPHLGSENIRPIQFAEAYARLVAVSCARAEFLGVRLAEAYEREGLGGLIGHKFDADKFGTIYEASEETRGLAAMEERERDRAARLIKDGLRIGIEARHVDVMRSYGHTVVTSLREFAGQLGLDWNDEAIKRAASRAIVAARTQMGDMTGTMDRVGPPLSEAERARITGGAE